MGGSQTLVPNGIWEDGIAGIEFQMQVPEELTGKSSHHIDPWNQPHSYWQATNYGHQLQLICSSAMNRTFVVMPFQIWQFDETIVILY